jgi:hypothetical protein
MEINNECILCLEINKVIYLLPCLHKICSECLTDVGKDLKTNSKYKCVQCHEQFDFDIIKTKRFTNDFLNKCDFNLNDEEIFNNKNFIDDNILTTTKTIQHIRFELKNLNDYKMSIETNYEKILFDINKLDIFYNDLKEKLIDQKNSFEKSDLKIISLEIENVTFLLERYDKFLLKIKSINPYQHSLEIISNYINYINPNETLTELTDRSLIRVRILDDDYEISYSAIEYEMNYYYAIFNDNYKPNIPLNVTDLTIYSQYTCQHRPRHDMIYIPKSVKHLTLYKEFDENIKKYIIIPNSVTHLTFLEFSNQDIKNFIPNSVTHLTFNCNYNKSLKGCIPNSVTHLTLDNNYDLDIKDCIPNSVTHLTTGKHKIHSIKDCIPNSVTHLTLGYFFNENIKDLIPSSVTHLTFGCTYNRSVRNCIPNSITHIRFGNDFNQCIDDSIPDSVIYLSFSVHFNQEITPISKLKNLKYLTLGWLFNQSIKNCIPNSVTHLTFSWYFNQDIKDCIPKSVTHLILGGGFFQNIEGCIPNSVTHLTINSNINIKGCIPNSVTHLTFGDYFNQNIYECIPNSVTHLIFGYQFNQNIKDCIPNSVTHLTFCEKFNQNIYNCIPSQCKYLSLGYEFNQDIKDCIPSSVTVVNISNPKYPWINHIPNTVKKITYNQISFSQ